MTEMHLTPSGDEGFAVLRMEISAKLWRLLVEEAAREGVDPAVYAREAIIGRVHNDRGLREAACGNGAGGAEPVETRRRHH